MCPCPAKARWPVQFVAFELIFEILLQELKSRRRRDCVLLETQPQMGAPLILAFFNVTEVRPTLLCNFLGKGNAGWLMTVAFTLPPLSIVASGYAPVSHMPITPIDLFPSGPSDFARIVEATRPGRYRSFQAVRDSGIRRKKRIRLFQEVRFPALGVQRGAACALRTHRVRVLNQNRCTRTTSQGDSGEAPMSSNQFLERTPCAD